MTPFDSAGAFVEVAHQGSFRQVVTRSAGISVLSGFAGVSVQMVGTVTLGRLLTPADFGLVAMVTAFSMLLMNIGLNGFTEAVIQRKSIDRQLISNLFWINVAAGVVLTMAFAGGARLLSWFYREPRLTTLAVVISVVIVLNCSSVLHLALLKRAMKFTETSVIEVTSRAASVVVAVTLALAGWGYWALAAAAIACPVTTLVMALIWCPWVPARPRRAAGTAAMVLFAMNIYGRYTVNYFGMTTDQLLLGWRFNAQILGFYKKAFDLFFLAAGLSVSRLGIVAVAALSRLARNPAQYKKYVLNIISVVALIAMGIGGVLTLAGGDVIRIVLGPGWDVAGRILKWFGFGTGMMLVHEVHGWIHLSLGRADRWFRWGILELGVTALLFVIALRWGATGMAFAWTTAFWILTIPAVWYAGRPIRLGICEIVDSLWRPLIASALAGWSSAVILRGTPWGAPADGVTSALIRAAAVFATFAPLYVVAAVVLYRGVVPVRRIVALIRDIVFPYSPSPNAPSP